jgi:predicted small secreted protein
MKTQLLPLARRLVPWLLVLTLLAIVSVGCNTAKGLGKDVENAGEAIQDGAK